MSPSVRRCSSASNSAREGVAGRRAATSTMRKVKPHGVARCVLVGVAEVVGEAGEQVALGDQQIDRKAHAKLLVQLLHALAHRARVLGPLGRAARQQVGHRHRHQHAVQRLARPAALQQAEKAGPGLAVAALVAVLRGVAARGVDQHRLVGEPPVAVARAADAAKLVLRRASRRAETCSPELTQRGGLARAGRADDDVPRQLVQVALAQARRHAADRPPPGPSRRD